MELIDDRATGMSVTFRMFRGGPLIAWDALFQQAADFASDIGPDRLISISHSSDHSDGIVTVWYWQ
jgi:hypothetical protein